MKNSLRLFSLALASFVLPLTAHAAPGASIQSLFPGISVPIGTQAGFTIVSSDFNAALSYSVQDSKSGSSITNANIQGNGVFTWIPAAQDVGDHTVSVTVSDGTGNSVQVQQYFSVPPRPAVTIQNVSGTSVYPLNTIFFSAVSVGFTNPQYVVSDSIGSSLRASAINGVGGFSWTPQEVDVGTHTITVFVTDSSGHYASADLTVTVKAPPSLSVTPSATSTVAYVGSALSLKIQANDFTSPVYSVSDSLFGSALPLNAVHPATGEFSWTPKANETGLHTLTFTAQDYSYHFASLVINVHVLPATTTTIAANTSAPLAETTYATTTKIAIALPNLPNMANMSEYDSTSLNRFKFLRPLKFGMRGYEITELQKRLIDLKLLSSEPTGYFGPLTLTAVKAFQKSRGLEQVGSVGPLTRAALNDE